MKLQDTDSSSVTTTALPVPPPPTPEEERRLAEMYRKFDDHHMVPLWSEIGNIMPSQPEPSAVPYAWRWSELSALAKEAGELVPVGRGGERRAIALANPGLQEPFASPTLWCAIQYLGPREVAPEHRHSQNAFRFVVEGEGVWTVVNGDPVRMSRGDFLLTPAWCYHGHHNETDEPMAWIDGLDVPFVHYTDGSFFELGPLQVTDQSTPQYSRSERLWAHPCIRPVSSKSNTESSPIAAYRWEHTDSALNDQLALEDEGHPVTVEPGHAAIRFVNPTTGADVLPTIRAEFHRLRPGTVTESSRVVGSRVFQAFEGRGRFVIGEKVFEIEKGDVVVVPSWARASIEAESSLDLFSFSDEPIIEKLGLSSPPGLVPPMSL